MKKTIWLIISSVFLFFFKFLPINIGLSEPAMQMLGIFIGAVILWLAVGIDWPSILVLFALCLLPGNTPASVFAASFGNSTIAFLIFSFMLTYSLSETGFLKRCALWFINNPFARKSIWNFIFMYLCAIMAIGAFIAPTVTFLVFFALVKEIYAQLNLQKGSVTAKVMMVSTAIITSVSCAATPIAHTFPLMAMGFYEAETGKAISYFEYLKIGLPSGLLIFAVFFFFIKLIYSKQISAEKTDLKAMNIVSPGKITKREKVAAAVFMVVVCVWIFSGVWPKTFVRLNALGTSVPAMLATVFLCLVSIDKKPVLSFKDAVTNGISWQSIMLCSATLAVGKFLTQADFGITALFAKTVAPLFNGQSHALIYLAVIMLSILLTNLISNIVTTSLMYGIISPIVAALSIAGVLVNGETAAILIGLCASLAYATPPAIAHVAIAAGSEWATPKDMLFVGSAAALFSGILVWIVCIV